MNLWATFDNSSKTEDMLWAVLIMDFSLHLEKKN